MRRHHLQEARLEDLSRVLVEEVLVEEGTTLAADLLASIPYMNTGGALAPEFVAGYLALQESAASARSGAALQEAQPRLHNSDPSRAAPCIRSHLRWGELCTCLDCCVRRIREAQEERTKWAETKAAWAIATRSQQHLGA